MRRMPTLLGLSLVLALASLQPAFADSEPQPEQPIIEIAILLDTSGSMDGLINQARTRLWDIVNSLAVAKKGDVLPDLRVALYEYGKSSELAENGFIRQIVPLTDDLDKIAEELFALTTNGGSEHCGQVIQKAVEQLTWTEGDHFRAIFIAGNEPFTQGPIDYKVACQNAINKGIVVNTIHCGAEQAGKEGQWHHAATLADGNTININAETESVQIQAPQDERLAELGRKINDTYLAFGEAGKARKDAQAELDERAQESAGAPGEAQRAMAKGGRFYKNSQWDLIDALEEGTVTLEELKDEELPEELAGLSLEEKQARIDEMKTERAGIQEEIQRLTQERRKFVAEERKKLAEEGADTFDTAVQELLKRQLEKRSFQFGDE